MQFPPENSHDRYSLVFFAIAAMSMGGCAQSQAEPIPSAPDAAKAAPQLDVSAPRAADADVIQRHIVWLGDSDGHQRRNAASALAAFGPAAKEAVEPLTRALANTSDEELRMYAARSLGAIGPGASAAVPVLRQALSDRADFGSHFVRAEAAKALGAIGLPAAGVAVDDLLPLLDDDDLYVRREASNSLGLLREPAIPGLIRTLEHENPEPRYRAAIALSRMGPLAFPALEAALSSDHSVVREGAARAFASCFATPPIEAVPALIDHLHDQEPTVRRWIASALALCVADSPMAMKAIVKDLASDDDVSFEIIVALSRAARSEKSLRKLLAAMEHQPPNIRSQVIRAVGFSSLESRHVALAIPCLWEQLKDPECGLRAAEALSRLAPESGEVKRLLDEYFARHDGTQPYPGFRDDVRLAVRSEDLEGPSSSFSTPEACLAASRIFQHIDFVGMHRLEVIAILGDPKALSGYARGRHAASAEKLVYCYATGFKGKEYTLTFKDGRVASVDRGALY